MSFKFFYKNNNNNNAFWYKKKPRKEQTAVLKAYRELVMIRKTFKFFNINFIFKIMFPTFIRTHLEFTSSVCDSMTKRDINKI